MIRQQVLRFIIIGVLSTVVNYTTFYIIYTLFSVYYIISSAAGFIAGVFSGYNLNKNWTFGAKEKTHHYIYKYSFIYTVSLFIGLGFLKFLVSFLGIIPAIANLLTIGLTTCTNFIGTKFWVFKKQRCVKG